MNWNHTLIETDWPDTGPAEPVAWATAEELQGSAPSIRPACSAAKSIRPSR